VETCTFTCLLGINTPTPTHWYLDCASLCGYTCFCSTSAVIFVGVNTQGTDVYGIKTDKQFVNTLEDNIIQQGYPNKLSSLNHSPFYKSNNCHNKQLTSWSDMVNGLL
jgi:hypothetical protein